MIRRCQFHCLGDTARRVEGPILFPFNQERKWGLLVDQYGAGKGCLPLLSLDDPRGFHVLPSSEFSLGASRKRHGGVLKITRSEYEALRAKWPSQFAASPPSEDERMERVVRSREALAFRRAELSQAVAE